MFEEIENCLNDCRKLENCLDEELYELSKGLSGDVLDEYKKVISQQQDRVREIMRLLKDL